MRAETACQFDTISKLPVCRFREREREWRVPLNRTADCDRPSAIAYPHRSFGQRDSLLADTCIISALYQPRRRRISEAGAVRS